MKKLKFLSLFLIVSIFVCFALTPMALALDEPDITSGSALVIDRKSGSVLYSKNADWKVYPASTTKIMTVLLAVEAIENGDVSIHDEITAGQSMTYDLIDDGSTAGILVGETMTLESFLYCAMISSANEACNVIAEYIGGSIPGFIDLMNERATELGCTDTHFANTHGLPDEEHYTTPNDFVRIALEASGHDLFMQICNTKSVTIPATNKSEARTLNNSNALISDQSIYGANYLYEYAAGMKTGYTSAAGYCLASTAAKDDVELLAVVFGGATWQESNGVSSYSNFADTIALYDWVFDNFSYQDILRSSDNVTQVSVELGSDGDYVNLRPESSITSLMPNDFSSSEFDRKITIYSEQEGEALFAPIEAGEVLGEISISKGGVNYGTVKLVASTGVDLSRIQYMKSEIRKTIHSTLFQVVFWGIVVLLCLYVALVIAYRVKRKKHIRAVRAAKEERARKLAQQQAAQVPPSPATPKIDYFSEDDDISPAPETPSSADAAAKSDEPPSSVKAERDYFEEFFKSK